MGVFRYITLFTDGSYWYKYDGTVHMKGNAQSVFKEAFYLYNNHNKPN